MRGQKRRRAPARGVDVNEKGESYRTPVVGTATCEHCGDEMPVRAEGRNPRFCSVACRVASAREQPPRLF